MQQGALNQRFCMRCSRIRKVVLRAFASVVATALVEDTLSEWGHWGLPVARADDICAFLFVALHRTPLHLGFR
jgi:hypothetical protein